MKKPLSLTNIARAAMAGVLAAVLACGAPLAALAQTSQELEQQADAARAQREAFEAQVLEAQQRLGVLYEQAELCENDLITVESQLDATVQAIEAIGAQIVQTTSDLAQKREDLADIVADNYKHARRLTLIELVLSARSIDDLVSRISYANKVVQHESDVVEAIKSLIGLLEQQKANLEEQKALQEQLVAEQRERLAAVQAAAAQLEEYRDQLSWEIMAKIEEEQQARAQAAVEAAREAEEARRKAEEEARRKAEEEARLRAEEEARRQAGQQRAGQQTSSSAGSSGGSSSGGGGAVDAASLVDAAYGIIGSGYSWSGYSWDGGTDSSWFTCSGVVDYALGRKSRSSSPETLYEEVGSNLVSSVSDLNYGDLVFYSTGGRYPGHVGIYVGDGNIIDSAPGSGVAIHNVDYLDFIGGGAL